MPEEGASRLAKRKESEPLTPRELEVLHELAKGLANKQIADVMNISQHTAKGYLKTILTKLHVADRTEAVTVAIQRGLTHIKTPPSSRKIFRQPAAFHAMAEVPFRRLGQLVTP